MKKGEVLFALRLNGNIDKFIIEKVGTKYIYLQGVRWVRFEKDLTVDPATRWDWTRNYEEQLFVSNQAALDKLESRRIVNLLKSILTYSSETPNIDKLRRIQAIIDEE